MKARLNARRPRKTNGGKLNLNFTRKLLVDNLLARLTAIFLLSALLTPFIYLGDERKVFAAANLPPVSAPAPVAAPPEAAVFASLNQSSNQWSNAALASLTAVDQFLVSGYYSISDSIISPAPPEGFAMAKVPTVWENVSGGLSSFVAARIAPLLFSPSTTAATATTASLAALPHAPGTTKFDFDGDGKADASRWQPVSGAWKIKNSTNGSFSTLATVTGTSAAPADYDGNGTTNPATFTDWSGTWKIIGNSAETIETVTPFGQAGDKAVAGDYDGDGKADIAVWRPSNGTWYVRRSSNGQVTSTIWGQAGDIPVPGNYDGAGGLELAVFRPSDGTWYVKVPGNGGSYTYFQWGASGDIPVPASYDNDNKTDFAMYRPSNGTWYINRSDGGAFIGKTWGNYGDQPVPADYDGDGKADIAVWRPTTGVWYVVKSSDPALNTYDYHQLGIAGDIAAPSSYLKQTGAQLHGFKLANARLAPQNATGGTDFYSRNFSWGTSLVNLPGRAGLDAGFGISYNSLVWTKEAFDQTMVFDADHSNVSPGFRFGFPTIEPSYYNEQTQQISYLMVTTSGGRVEFRQQAASNLYTTADSSYANLVVIPGQQNSEAEYSTLVVTTTDGTQLIYVWRAGAYRCAEIKDPNGNVISILHDEEHGLLRLMVDTLGRAVTVTYDSEFYPTAIQQQWKTGNGDGSPVTHTYATFSYTYKEINPSFDSSLAVFGPSGSNVKVLNHITYSTNATTAFEYNHFGQVSKIINSAPDGSLLNHTRTNLDAPGTNQTDCPRFTETYTKIRNFNNGAEVLTRNTLTAGATFTAGGETLGPANVVEVWTPGALPEVDSKTYYYGAGNWAEGLPFGTEDVVGGVQKRWTRTVWTQDDLSKNYPLNPRVVESRVGDESNTKKTTIEYLMQPNTNVSVYGLPHIVKVYDADQTTVLKKAVTEYKHVQAYLERNIYGLPSRVDTLGLNQQTGALELVSKMTYEYDEGDFGDASLQQDIPSAIQHDNTYHSANFIVGRGNLTSVTKHDVAGATNAVTSSVKYNTAGAPVAQITPGTAVGTTREVKISYADAFNDNINRNTFAYPTTITDPAGNFSSAQYRFDMGANVWAKSPAPHGNTIGKITKRAFDAIGRLEKESVLKNNAEYAYTKYEYSLSQSVATVKTTLTDTNGNNVGDAADEVVSESHFDGAGRTIESRSPMSFASNGNVATWTGQKAEYDLVGRVKRQTVPTEIDANWNPTGPDTNRGWQWTSQEYDWKGRVTREIGLDNVDRLYAYDGCGCAGGQVTTAYGELVDGERRTQKMYADILGRTWKTEILDYNDDVYTSTITKFNGRDQAVWTKQFSGDAPSGALDSDTCPAQPTGEAQSCQIAVNAYDGYGRLKTSHAPEQDAGKATTYDYNPDDSLEKMTDARGAISTYAYNNRGLVETIQQTMPINQPTMPFATCAPDDAECFMGDGTNLVTSSPVGFLDGADSTSRVISGWTVDKDSVWTSLQVHFYLDGPSGGGGTIIGSTIANKSRPDVNRYYPGDHGYEFVVPEQYADGKPHLIYAYGIDVAGNNPNTLLTNSPKAILLNPATKTTTYEYDNLGNRTKMTDETGVTNYEYDPLSRVKAENKHLKDSWSIARHDFNIAYDYDLTGQLKSVTDPFGDKISYAVDKTGKLKGISGTPFNSTDGYGTAAVTDYINDIEYRAWGAVESIDYGNTIKMTQTFDSRLRVGGFNVQKNGQSAALIKKAYQYYNDDRLKFSDDTGDTYFRADSHRFDRSYSYDFMGRLTAAKTGAEARGATTNIDRTATPYKHDYAFNAFGNVTSRQTFTWTEANNQTHTWRDGRETTLQYDAQGVATPLWWYDADGRLKHTPENNYDYDAGGAMSAIALADERVTFQQTDGEARTVRRDFYKSRPLNGWNTFEKTEYAIYSSVLGKLLSEVKADGTKKRTFVYGAGGVVATQNTQGAMFQHVAWGYQDPSKASFISTTHSGAPIYLGEDGQAELDPLGSNVGMSNPYDQNNPPNLAALPGGGWGGWGDPSGSYSCMVDWVSQPCSYAAQVLGAGAGSIGPLDPIAAWQQWRRPDGSTFWRAAFWERGANGQLGYNSSRDLSGGTGTDNDPIRMSETVWHSFGKDEWVDRLWNAIHLMRTRIEITYSKEDHSFEKEENRNAVYLRIMWLLVSQECEKAFKDAELPTPAEVIRDRGMTIAAAGLLSNPNNNKLIGINEDMRQSGLRSVKNTSVQAFTIVPEDSISRIYMFFKNNAFDGASYLTGTYSLDEIVPHEFTHASKVGIHDYYFLGIKIGHDLTGFKHYNSIKENCSLPKGLEK